MDITDEPLRILLVEDDEDDYLIVRSMLVHQDRTLYELDWCAHYEDALTQIREQLHDVYLVDYGLGQHNGLELVRAARPRAPVILLSGHDDHKVDLDATALGVAGYLIKHQLDSERLERSIRYAVMRHKAITRLTDDHYALALGATRSTGSAKELDRVEGKMNSLVDAVFGNPLDAEDHGMVGDIRDLRTSIGDKLERLYLAVLGLAGTLIVVGTTATVFFH